MYLQSGLIFVVALAVTALADVQCPDGYETQDNQICYKFYKTKVNRTTAVSRCAMDGGYLASVPSEFNNDILGGFLENTTAPMWLGITCNSTLNNCKNDDGTQFGPYQNFPGSANNLKPFGKPYVYKSFYSPEWYFVDKAAMNYSFTCELPVAALCLPGYTFWRGNCYGVRTAPLANEAVAENYCKADNGHLVSIHSADENEFVFSLLQATNGSLFRIGLQLSSDLSVYTWTDGTVVDYYISKIDNLRPDLGNCFAMASKNRNSAPGNWSSVSNRTSMPFICKAGKVYQNKMILSPLQCNASTYLSGNGTVFSPGYPLPYARSDCEYIIYGKQEEQVQLDFSLLKLANGATITVYNDESLSEPLLTLNANTTKVQPITSTFGQLVVLFEYANDVAATGTGWQMNYKPVATSTTNKQK